MFLSTPPSRVATSLRSRRCPFPGWGYPRHPRGWRHNATPITGTEGLFLSTPPSRVATGRVERQTLLA